MKNGGCWIFLSHASKDISKVRMIRNEFEKMGQNPLAFHLKCMDNQYVETEEELWKLIYREIDAREWFVYCKSPAAEGNDNVLRERNYIEKSGKNKIWEIDITEEWEKILEKIYKICTDLEVFISYSHHDQTVADVLRKLLVKKDYSVWMPVHNVKNGNSWNMQMSNAITRCGKKGFYVLLISKESVRSRFIEDELEYASRQGAWIVPIIMGNPIMKDRMKLWLSNWQCARVSDNPTEQELDDIIKLIDTFMLKKIENFSLK